MIYFLLCCVSLVEVYSASSRMTFSGGSHWGPLTHQFEFLLGGFCLIYVFHLIPCKFYSFLAPLAWPFWFSILVFTVVSSHALNGTNRWLQIGGFSFQPSEFVKGALIMWTALVLAKNQSVVKDAKGKILVGAVKGEKYDRAFKWIAIPLVLTCGTIFADNVSTAVMLFLIISIMMILGRVPWQLLLKGLGGICLVLGLVMSVVFVTPEGVLEQTPLKRLVTLKYRVLRFNEDDNIVFGSDQWAKQVLEDKNSQSTYAKIAIANSNGIGLGPGNSVQRDFLQHAESDFIYAIVIEEFGLIGGLVVMALYIVLLVRTGRIAQKCRRFFPAFLVIGFGLMMAVQALVNMAVAVGAIPVTGQTLPFISRGGTSILATSFYIAAILSVSRYAESAQLADENPEPVTEGETNEFATEGNMA